MAVCRCSAATGYSARYVDIPLSRAHGIGRRWPCLSKTEWGGPLPYGAIPMNAPGSPSSPLQIKVGGPVFRRQGAGREANALAGRKTTFLPRRETAPPRPRRPERLVSSITCSGGHVQRPCAGQSKLLGDILLDALRIDLAAIAQDHPHLSGDGGGLSSPSGQETFPAALK